MSLLSPALTRQKLCVDFGSLKHACPKGVYVAAVPDEPLLWSGVLFVRKGPYANAILRFQIDFPDDYPARPPVVAFQNDLFHPLVSPLTTYTHTHSTRDLGTDTQSAVDEQRLPPGGLSLRHGFPEWFDESANEAPLVREERDANVSQERKDHQGADREGNSKHQRAPHIIELLQYMRIVFDTEDVLDAIPLEAAANTGAWHAWQSYRAKIASRAASLARPAGDARQISAERSTSPRQQPGGARRPGEWNWQGVWEDRVRRCVQATQSEPMLFGGESNDVISFLRMDPEAISKISPVRQSQSVA